MSSTATATKPANKYAGSCTVCGTHVAAQAGTLAGKVNGRWAVKCSCCGGTTRTAARKPRTAHIGGASRGCQTGGDCWSFSSIAHCHSCGK